MIRLVKEENIINFTSDSVFTQNSLNNLLTSLQSFFVSNNMTNDYEKLYSDLNNKEFKIAVVANMSSGKSTFVNSLFGKDILPSFNEATTDCPTYIHSGEEQQKLVVHFEDSKPSIEITENIFQEIKLYARKDSPDMSLDYMNVKEIHLYYDFLNLKNNKDLSFKFTFIDTAGPNNQGDFSDKHRNFTADIISNEADFVIFLFDYGQLDANLDSDALGLWSLIKQRKAKDKFFDVLFLINKIDMAIDDNEADNKDRGYFEQKAIEKLEFFAMSRHSFVSPQVLGVSSSYAFLSRADITNDKNLNRKYKKIIVDFEEINQDNPKEEIVKYSNIENVENIILNYINNTIQQVIVDKTKTTLLDTINKIYEDINTKQNELQIQIEQYRQEISRIQEFENGQFYKIIEDMRRDINLLFNKEINAKKDLIVDIFDKSIQSDIEKIIYECTKDSFNEILENKELKISEQKILNINYNKKVNPNRLREKFVETFNWLLKRREINFVNKYKELLLSEQSQEFTKQLNTIINDGVEKLNKVLNISISANNNIKNFSFFDAIDVEIHKDLNLQPNHIAVMIIREVKQIEDSYVIQNKILEDGYKVETRIEANGTTKVLKQIENIYTVQNIPKYQTVEVKVPQYVVKPEKVYKYKTQVFDSYRVTLYIEAMKKHIQQVSCDGKLDIIKHFEANLRKRFTKTLENIFKNFDTLENEFQGDLSILKEQYRQIQDSYEIVENSKKEILNILKIA